MLLTVFISSSGGLANERKAAAAAVDELGLRSDVFEDWPALSEAPESASLTAVRDSNLCVILLGARYGSLASTGRSIIHDEYLTARAHGIPVLAFRIDDGKPEPSQREFIAAVEQNETIAAVTSSDDLRDQLRKAITRELVRQGSREKPDRAASRDVHLAADRLLSSPSICKRKKLSVSATHSRNRRLQSSMKCACYFVAAMLTTPSTA